MQSFIDSLLDECAKVGISEIGQNVPETAWHGGGQNTVEDTLRTAVQYGQETFGQKPRIIFILLPGNGRHLCFCVYLVSVAESLCRLVLAYLFCLRLPRPCHGVCDRLRLGGCILSGRTVLL